MSKPLHTWFTQEESQRIEAGLPRLEQWSRMLLVPFTARRLRRASILWTNDRWFLERGFDLRVNSLRTRVSGWLLAEFGFAVACSNDSPDCFTNYFKTLHADRYGSTSGRSVHGGGARVATIGCFQAKGIGLTPLAGVGTNWVHSHGCVSLEEGIREAIFGEVAGAEFPHGAIPVIAILGTGLNFQAPKQSGEAGVRMPRVIVVRPSVLRIAHAQRAPLFNRTLCGYTNSQTDDVQKTKDVIERWMNDTDSLSLSDLVVRVAEQVAFGQLQRLFNGGYFSSNLTVAGALLDYGGMRSLPNWANARTLDRIPGFGEEMTVVSGMLDSLAFYFNKYRPLGVEWVDAAALRRRCMEAHRRAFTSECLRIWGLDGSCDQSSLGAIAKAVLKYFVDQQKDRRANYKHGRCGDSRWLYEAIADSSFTAHESPDHRQHLESLRRHLEEHFSQSSNPQENLRLAWSTALRYLKPRGALDRERLQSRINALLARTGGESALNQSSIKEFIESNVGVSRRHWIRAPKDLLVHGHVNRGASTALFGSEFGSQKPALWLEGIYADGHYHCFDGKFARFDDHSLNGNRTGPYWTTRVTNFASSPTWPLELRLGNATLLIPAPQVVYPGPSSALTVAR